MGENENPEIVESARPAKALPVQDSVVPEPAESDDVSVSLAGPFYVTSFVGHLGNGDKLTVEKDGARVSAADAASLVAQAAASGVNLRIGE